MASRRVVVQFTDNTGELTLKPGNKREFLRVLASQCLAVAGGSRPPGYQVEVRDGAVKASGTLTSTNAIATDAISVNGVTFTCVASGATGNQWNLGADDTADCVNLAAAINASASALVSDHVTATSSGNVVTITAKAAGTAGNAITISSAGATIVASGARLTGGTETYTSVTY